MQKITRLLLTILWMTVFALRPAFSQKETTHKIRISLLTCSPGTELYATFGHTAIRVTDSINDIVFNYGTFDFSDPDFYTKFVKGKLDYFLSIEYYQDFFSAYQHENRSIYEQELNLAPEEQEKLFKTLLENARQENKFYKYDFLLNNCTTKAKDRIGTAANVTFHHFLKDPPPTFRDFLHEYLKRPDQQWVRLGIDLLMGQEADQKLSMQTALFLPDYLKKGVENATINKAPLAKNSSLLLPSTPIPARKALTPNLFFWSLVFIIAFLSMSMNSVMQKILHGFDRVFFFIIGILGFILIFLWVGTDHHAFSKNWNILWAFPVHAIVACMNFNRLIVKKYFTVVFWCYMILLVLTYFLPQDFNDSVIPILTIMGVRAYHLKKIAD